MKTFGYFFKPSASFLSSDFGTIPPVGFAGLFIIIKDVFLLILLLPIMKWKKKNIKFDLYYLHQLFPNNRQKLP